MGIQNIGTRALAPRRSKTGLNRFTLVIALCAVLGFLGSLTLAATASLTNNKPNTSTINSSATFWTTSHFKTPQNPQIATTSTPMPISTSTPSPIRPFPDQLWQEIAVLQGQNRFLYNGNRGLSEVALTFDDGPNPYYTPQILAILQQYGIKATFFCIGRQVAAYPDLVRQEYAAGNIIGNHSWSHPDLGLLSSDAILKQINMTSDAISQAIGVQPTFFRPPYGVFDTQVLTQANLLGLTTVIWNDEARDWLLPGTGVITSRILGLAGNGAIILLHDGGGDRSQTVAALPTIITTLRARGLKFVTLQQLANDLPKNPAANQAPVSIPTPTPTADPTPTPTLTATPHTFAVPSPMTRRREVIYYFHIVLLRTEVCNYRGPAR